MRLSLGLAPRLHPQCPPNRDPARQSRGRHTPLGARDRYSPHDSPPEDRAGTNGPQHPPLERKGTHVQDPHPLTSARHRPVPGGLAAWGFVDLDSPQHDERRQSDLDGFFAEARLTRAVWRGLSVQVEFNDATGLGNDLLRLGLVYKVPTPSAVILLRGFPLESDGDGWQAGVVWRWRPLPQPFFFEGFADYNVAETANRWVIEPQLRYMLTSEIGVVFEGRRNEFIGGNRDNTGLAVGIALML